VSIEIQKEFRQKFKEIGAEEVFDKLRIGSEEEFQDALLNFEGDRDRLKELIDSFKAAKEKKGEQEGGWESVIAKFKDSNTTKLKAIKESANYLLK